MWKKIDTHRAVWDIGIVTSHTDLLIMTRKTLSLARPIDSARRTIPTVSQAQYNAKWHAHSKWLRAQRRARKLERMIQSEDVYAGDVSIAVAVFGEYSY